MSGLQLISGYDSLEEDEDLEITEDPGMEIKEEPMSSVPLHETDEMRHQDVLLVLATIVNTVVKLDQHPSRFGCQFRTTTNECEIKLDGDDSDSSSSSSNWSLKSDSLSDIVVSDEELEVPGKTPRKPRLYGGPKTKGELDLDELPPLDQLNLECPSEQLTHIGRVVSVVDTVVIVQSFKGQPPLNLDAVLFMKDGHALGSIFDVFGPVLEPRYVVRFNDNEDITKKNVSPDTPVYYSSYLQEPFTSYVFTRDLMRMKGSDASWKHNHEPPETVREYSDDEEERRERAVNNRQKRKVGGHQHHVHQQKQGDRH